MAKLVTNEERRLAHLMASDAARYQQRGIAVASRIGFRTMRLVLAAWKKHQWDKITTIIRTEMLKGKDELRDFMVLAYLMGRKRSARMADLSLSSASNPVSILQKQLTLTKEQVEVIRQEYDAEAFRVLTNVSDVLDEKVQKAMIDVISEGLHVREGKARLQEAFDDVGITPSNSYQVENLYRTQMSTAYSAAKWQHDREPVIDEILWGYKYATVGDDRVRPNHVELEGVTLPKDDPFWQIGFPPNGWSCRCVALELFEEREIVEPPAGWMPDDGWAFNPGEVFARIAG